MRDVLLVTFLAVALPLMLWRPAWGALGLGLVRDHEPAPLAWGFAATIPFAWAIGIATVHRRRFLEGTQAAEGRRCDGRPVLFVVYMIFTTFFALVPDRAWPMLERAVKIQVGTLLALIAALSQGPRPRADLGHRWLDRLLRGQGRHLHDRDARPVPGLGSGGQLHCGQQRLRPGDRDVDPAVGLPVYAVQGRGRGFGSASLPRSLFPPFPPSAAIRGEQSSRSSPWPSSFG